jgi:predicted nucleotidyltransferase
VLAKYGAVNPRIFGSVARGDATESSDLDVLVDLLPGYSGSRLLRVSGVAAGFEAILGHKVDVVTPGLLRENVSQAALVDAIAL